MSQTNFNKWYENHKNVCTKNFDESSGQMEVEGATRMFGRSMERYNFRYTVLIGDGDSKAYNAVVKMNPYGEIKVKKNKNV